MMALLAAAGGVEPSAGLVMPALVAAAVAACITLMIEFAAKPALEVRKERILRRHRARLDLADTLAKVASCLSKLFVYDSLDPAGQFPRFVHDIPEIPTERLEQLNRLLDEADHYLRRAEVGAAVRGYTWGRLGYIQTMAKLYKKTDDETADWRIDFLLPARDELEYSADLLKTPRHRILKRYRLTKYIRTHQRLQPLSERRQLAALRRASETGDGQETVTDAGDGHGAAAGE